MFVEAVEIAGTVIDGIGRSARRIGPRPARMQSDDSCGESPAPAMIDRSPVTSR